MENLVMQCRLNDFYKGKKVFITGHTGFKGSWLANWLHRVGAELMGYALPPDTNPNHYESLKIQMQSCYDDICNRAQLASTINSFQPDIVFHLAAQALVSRSYQDPYRTFETNVMGTLNVLEASRNCESVKAVVCVTSDKVYFNQNQSKPFTEEDKLGGADPYSASKSAAEMVAYSYQKSFLENSEQSYSLATARAGNVIGGGDWAEDRLIPDLMKGASKMVKTIIRNPGFIRPWQHVLESVTGYLVLGKELSGKNSRAIGAWNFGPGNNEVFSVQQVTEMAQSQWNKIQPDYKSTADQKRESSFLSIDSTRSQTRLLWKPVWDTTQAVLKTIQWYKEFYENGKLITNQQLEEYSFEAKQKGINWTQA